MSVLPPPKETKKKRVNAVEVAVLSVVASMCALSLVQLLRNPPDLGASLGASAPERGLASQVVRENVVAQARARSALSLEINQCNASLEQPPTTAARARLSGLLCGYDPAGSTSQLLSTHISNLKSGYTATVFTDLRAGRFSTEYIPLTDGANVLSIHFKYEGGKSFKKEIEITKN